MRRLLRPLGIVAATTLVVMSLGTSVALADPGNGKGKGQVAASDGGAAASTGAAATPAGSGGGSSGAKAHGGGHPKASSSKATHASPSKSSHSTHSTHSSHSSSKSTHTSSASSSGGSSNASSHRTSGTAGTSGDPTKPQPNSNADNNPGGANGQCPGGAYCSTRDGSPSLNGNGGGNATGKPCAGCVGKADNKNPKGQRPNGSDHNNGYECDGNNGIGKTNPAHTGCQPSTPGECVPKPGEDENCNPIPPGCVPKPGEDENCNPIIPPGCVPKPGEDENCVKGTEGRRPPVVEGVEAFRTPPPARVRPAAAALPNTGITAGVELLGVFGLGLVAAGAVTLSARRRETQP